MNDIKRYDQELRDQLAQVALPDEDLAWTEMKEMLDKNEDDPVIIPFYRRFGCVLLVLTGLLLLSVGGWFYYQKTKKEKLVHALVLPAPNDTTRKAVTTTSIGMTATGRNDSTPVSPHSNDQRNTDTAAVQQQQDLLNDASISRFASRGKTTMKFRMPGLKESSADQPVKRKNNRRTTDGKTTVNMRPGFAAGEELISTGEINREYSSDRDSGNSIGVQLPPAESFIGTAGKDSSLTAKKDSAVIKKTSEATSGKEDEPKKNNWILGAGLTVYQPFPLKGESAVPYNRYGRKGSLADYIPSAYFRIYRRNKWFIHTEFRYGAPQSVKPFFYKQDIRIDSSQSLIRSVYQLKKTYYHQVPFSFHYYVLPGLSLGTGVIYSRFGGAVANQDVYKGNNGAVDTLISSGIVSDPDKSRFVKNHFQWSAEGQYQWRRFSIGARYSRDMNPYIKFTDFITGESVEKKAETFNIFIRYELWRRR